MSRHIRIRIGVVQSVLMLSGSAGSRCAHGGRAVMLGPAAGS